MSKYTPQQAIFIAPSIFLVIILYIIPFISAIIFSFFSGRGNISEFCGFENYYNLFSDDVFMSAFGNSLLFTLIIVPSIIVFSVLVALALQKINSQTIQNTILLLLYIPCITSPVAYSLFFKQIAYSEGILSNLLRLIGIVGDNYNILQDVLGSRLLIANICIWAWSGFYIIILSVAMRNIDNDLYSAAKIDGANSLTIIRKIVFPNIRPVLILITILSIINAIQIYIESAIITKGGPNVSTLTLSTQLYKTAFTYVAQYGYSSAMGVIIFIICIVVTLLLVIILRKYASKD